MNTNDPDEIDSQLCLNELIDQGPVTRLQILLIGLCFSMMLLDGFDVLAMAFTAPQIASEWNLGGRQLGVVFSSALFGMALGSIFLGRVADIFGRRPVVITSTLLIGLSMTLTGFVQTLEQLVIARAITGLGIGAMLASVTSSVSEFTPDRHRNMAIGIVQAGYSIGAIIGGLIAAQVIPEFGWRSVFIGGGILTIVTSLAAIFLFHESIQFLVQKRPKKALFKLNHILKKLKHNTLKTLPRRTSENPSAPSMEDVLMASGKKATILLWVAFFMVYMTIYFLFSWMPKLLMSAGLSLEDSIYVSIAMNVGGALGMIIIGRLSVTFGLTRLILIFLILGAACMVLFGYVSNIFSVRALLAVTFMIGFFILGGFVGFYSVAARLYPSEIRTTGVGWAIGLGRAGAIIGPMIGGVLVSLHFPMMMNFIVFAAPLVIAGVCASFIYIPRIQAASRETV